MTTTTQSGTADNSVHVTATTTAPPDIAFRVFTERMQDWWNPDHHLLRAPVTEMNVEPFVGGRLWDTYADGRTCQWGTVLTWEPGQQFSFSWLVALDWTALDPAGPASRVTVTFTPHGTGSRVDLVHDRFEAHGRGWEGMRDGVGSPDGWATGIASFAAVATAA